LGKADLHIHTTASDGNSTPAQIVESAKHLRVIALTDHDTVAGYEEAQQAAKGTTVEVLTGSEITAKFNGKEAHLLAYCFDPGHKKIRKLLAGHKKARYDRGEWILSQLSRQGMHVDINEVKAGANGSNIGRPHIAAILVKKGFVGSIREAFIRYLSNRRLGDIPSDYLSCDEVIERVRDAGGAVVVAHPGQMYDVEELDKLVDAGVDGIEVIHPSHNYELQKKMQDYADRHNLLKTGGSDYHGGTSTETDNYQKYFGVVTISLEYVNALKRMTDQRKKMKVT
jgi:predicted metal-dependent phosphoesterase TrpH